MASNGGFLEGALERIRLRAAAVKTSVRTRDQAAAPITGGAKRTRSERSAAGIKTATRTPESIPKRSPRSGIVVTKPDLTGKNELQGKG